MITQPHLIELKCRPALHHANIILDSESFININCHPIQLIMCFPRRIACSEMSLLL